MWWGEVEIEIEIEGEIEGEGERKGREREGIERRNMGKYNKKKIICG